MSVNLNILCLVCINRYYIWNYAEFHKRMDFTQFFTQTHSEGNKNDH